MKNIEKNIDDKLENSSIAELASLKEEINQKIKNSKKKEQFKGKLSVLKKTVKRIYSKENLDDGSDIANEKVKFKTELDGLKNVIGGLASKEVANSGFEYNKENIEKGGKNNSNRDNESHNDIKNLKENIPFGFETDEVEENKQKSADAVVSFIKKGSKNFLAGAALNLAGLIMGSEKE